MIRRGDSSIEICQDIYATNGRHDCTECPLTPVGCPFGPFSCDGLRFTRAELQRHLSDPEMTLEHAKQVHSFVDEREKSLVSQAFKPYSVHSVSWHGQRDRQFDIHTLDCRWSINVKFWFRSICN